MERCRILAHRGWFKCDEEKNTDIALRRALANGFGIETDVRDQNGSLVISHDPPLKRGNHLPLSWLFQEIKESRSSARIALNIKSDGLCAIIKELMASAGINDDQVFAFDMSFPDMLRYQESDFPTYARTSEYEDMRSFSANTKGVWVDSFTGSYRQVESASSLIRQGIRAAIVSPELHKRQHQEVWNSIVASRLHREPLFELCTDYPFEASVFFSTNRV
jgi:hypothetical protein